MNNATLAEHFGTSIYSITYQLQKLGLIRKTGGMREKINT